MKRLAHDRTALSISAGEVSIPSADCHGVVSPICGVGINAVVDTSRFWTHGGISGWL